MAKGNDLKSKLESLRGKISDNDEEKKFEKLITKHAQTAQPLMYEESRLIQSAIHLVGDKPEPNLFYIDPIREVADKALLPIKRAIYNINCMKKKKALQKEATEHAKEVTRLIASTLIKHGKHETLELLDEKPYSLLKNVYYSGKLDGYKKLVDGMAQDFSPTSFSSHFCEAAQPLTVAEKTERKRRLDEQNAIREFADKLKKFEFGAPLNSARAITNFIAENPNFDEYMQQKDFLINPTSTPPRAKWKAGLDLHKKNAHTTSNSHIAINEEWGKSLQANPEFAILAKQEAKKCLAFAKNNKVAYNTENHYE